MIIVTITGLPKMGDAAKESLYRDCVSTLCLEKEWDLAEKDFVFDFLSVEIFSAGEKRKITVVVEGFDVEEAAGRLRNLFAHVLGAKIAGYFSDALVHVRVRPIDPAEGSWSSDRKPNIGRAVRQFERMLGLRAGVGNECLDYRRNDVPEL
jgi:hypothetical protein